jgi:hypothetical protein
VCGLAVALSGMMFYANRVLGEAQEHRMESIERKLDNIMRELKKDKKE